MINPQHAKQLAAWLAVVHPQFFAAFYRFAQQPVLSGLADDGFDVSSTDAGTTTLFDTSSSSDSSSMPEITVSAPSIPQETISDTLDAGSLASPSLDLTQITAGSLPNVSASGESSSFLSTVGTSLGNAISGVANFLGSKTGLTALSNFGTAYYKAQTPQSSVIGMQAGRVASGVAPGAVTYGMSPTGQLTPVAYNKSGSMFSLSSGSLSRLIPSSFGGLLLPLGILAGLALLASARKR